MIWFLFLLVSGLVLVLPARQSSQRGCSGGSGRGSSRTSDMQGLSFSFCLSFCSIGNSRTDHLPSPSPSLLPFFSARSSSSLQGRYVNAYRERDLCGEKRVRERERKSERVSLGGSQCSVTAVNQLPIMLVLLLLKCWCCWCCCWIPLHPVVWLDELWMMNCFFEILRNQAINKTHKYIFGQKDSFYSHDK